MRMVPPSRGHITQPFGNVIDGVPHAGQDYAWWDPDTGETYPEIVAAAAGVVLFAGDSRDLQWPNILYLNPDFDRSDNVDSSAGNYVMIRHPGGELTGYGHLAETLVVAGQEVTTGQLIGICGDSGNTRGKHLHFDYVPNPAAVSTPPFYGRTDPNTHIEDDDMLTPDEKKLLFGVLAEIHTAAATLPGQKDMAIYWKDLIGGVDATNNRTAAGIAAQINAAGLAEAVRDELVNLLKG